MDVEGWRAKVHGHKGWTRLSRHAAAAEKRRLLMGTNQPRHITHKGVPPTAMKTREQRLKGTGGRAAWSLPCGSTPPPTPPGLP